MKKFIIIFLLVLFRIDCLNAQPPCSSYKFDTLELNVLVEENAKFIYYTDGDAIFQDNLILPSSCLNSGSNLYDCDTVLFKEPYFVKGSEEYVRCMNLPSHAEFSSVFLQERKYAKAIKKSLVVINDIRYIKFYLKIVVVDLGSHEVFVPDAQSSNFVKSKLKRFSHTLQIIDVLCFCLIE